MSYILEALRRADAERERGAVPGLHAQSTVGEIEIPPTRERRPGVVVAAGVGVLAVAIGAIAWLGPWRGAPAPDTRTAAVPAMADAPAATTTSPAAAPAHPATADAVAPAAPTPTPMPAPPPQATAAMSPLPMASSLPPEVSQPRAPAPLTPTTAAPAAKAAPAAATADARAVSKALPAAPASGALLEGPVEHYGPPLAAAAPAPAPAPAANAIRKLSELPPGVRSQLPNLTVGGAIYSDTPSGRMLILNGQVYHEGDKPAADTVLEQIRLKSAVLNFRGTRYEITY
jgi:general secretion pathway protein B